MEVPYRAPVRGPTFIRMLARLSQGAIAGTDPSLSDQLSQWIDWTRAVALSRALDGIPATDAPASTASIDAAECGRVRALLVDAMRAPVDAGPVDTAEAPAFAPYLRHCQQQQRAMQAATGRLRGQLRERLATQSPGKARLADVDTVMEGVLSPREHALLAAVPTLLGEHFERLRDVAFASAEASALPVSTTWLGVFGQDMQNVLLAELDVRFQPIEGLLAALRTH